MRLLFVSTNYAPTIGGAETYAKDLCHGLARRGHSVTVLTSASKRDAETSDSFEEGVRVVRLAVDSPWNSGTSHWEQMAFGLLEPIAERLNLVDFDLIHANSQDTAILCSILALHAKLPLVLTSHEVGRAESIVGEGRCKFVFTSLPVDVHIAVSDYYRRILESMGAGDIRRIYPGVDETKFRPARDVALRSLFGIPLDAFLVCCPARFKERKGLTHLVEAAHMALESVPNLYVVLCGSVSSASATYEQELRDLIQDLGLGETVQIATDIPHSQMPSLLNTADLLVQPSHAEGLGLAVLEAMACLVPVAVSLTTGLDELVTNESLGHRFPVGDSNAIAQAIVDMAFDEERRVEMARTALARAKEVFSLERMIDETLSVYEGLIEKRSLEDA